MGKELSVSDEFLLDYRLPQKLVLTFCTFKLIELFSAYQFGDRRSQPLVTVLGNGVPPNPRGSSAFDQVEERISPWRIQARMMIRDSPSITSKTTPAHHPPPPHFIAF